MNINQWNRLSLLLNAYKLLQSYKLLGIVQKNYKKKRLWHKPWLCPSIREKYGAYHTLFLFFALKDHKEFYDFIHMSLDDFIKLLNMVKKRLTKPRSRRPAICPEFRLALVLHYLAHGTVVKNEAWMFYVGISTAYAFLPEVCGALAKELIPRYVKFPTQQEWLAIAEEFRMDCDFPNCIGALDGCHIEVEKPPRSGALFKNHKKFYSMVLMATCDARRRFTWFNFGDYGSCSDSSVFLETDLHRKLINNTADLPLPRKLPNSNIQTPHVFVCDSIFGLSKNLMKPYDRNKQLSMEEEIYNVRLTRTRQRIEHSFGILHEKFQVLQKPLAFKLKNIETLVCALIGLHNFCITENTQRETPNLGNGYYSMVENENVRYPNTIRDRFKEYFNSPEGEVDWQLGYL